MHSFQQGQTIIALLVFMMMAITLTTTAATITAINTRTNNSFIAGEQARLNAEIGVENSMQRLLRDNTYTGETMTLTDGTVTISVSGTNTKTIVSQGISGGLRRTITAVVMITNNVMTLNSWTETP
jgi:hypothetical protein